jgi:hypothetical protein
MSGADLATAIAGALPAIHIAGDFCTTPATISSTIKGVQDVAGGH